MELAMARALLLFLAALLTAPAFAAPGKARPAKCLFEIGDAHYIGSVCAFTPTDDKGSFRIAAASHADVSAEVTVTGAGRGVASWRHSLTRAGMQSIGEVQQTGACWSDGGEALICAWTPDQDVYLGPLHGWQAFVAYGQRWGMDDEIESATGLDTDHAVIHTKSSRRAAVHYCVGQIGHSKRCIEEEYRRRASAKDKTITANCPGKEWTGLDGSQYRFLGPFDSVDRSRLADNGGVEAKWAILDVKNNLLVGDCGACGYYMIHDWYQKLCPVTAPREW